MPRLTESWKAGSVKNAPPKPPWARPVRFSLGDLGETLIASATGEEILRLTHEEFCDMLRDLQIDPELEKALRCAKPPTP